MEWAQRRGHVLGEMGFKLRVLCTYSTGGDAYLTSDTFYHHNEEIKNGDGCIHAYNFHHDNVMEGDRTNCEWATVHAEA